jgi:iron complex outermembrane receptor protein
LVAFIPGERELDWENLFVQDEIRLQQDVRLTLGLKLDRNVYTGVEVLPSARIAWMLAADRLLWASASRAVRAPSRIDKEFFLPSSPPFLIAGGPAFVSERSNVLEAGYRAQAGRVSYSVTLFHERYDRLRSGEPQLDGSFQVQNGTAGRALGLEAWGKLQVSERWRLSAGLVELRQRFWTKPGFHDPDGAADLGNDPRRQWSLRSSFDLGRGLEFDIATRGVGELPDPRIPAYTAVDASLRWRPRSDWELAVFLHNALDAGHIEFAPGTLVPASEYERGAALRLQRRW